MRRSKSSIVVLAVLLISGCAMAQPIKGVNVDSLKRRLLLMPDDTLKVPALIFMGRQYEDNSPDTARSYYQQAGKLSRQLGYPAGIIQYIKNYTAVLNMQGEYDSSLTLNASALEIAREHGWQVEIMKTLANMGAVYQYKEAYHQALDYDLQALSLAEKLRDSQRLSPLYGNMCGIYRNLGQYDKAEVYARKALQLADASQDESATSLALNNLANVLKDRNRIAEGMSLLRRSYTIGQRLKDIAMQETALINMGDGYEKLRQPDNYMAAFRSALPLADSLGDVTGKAIILQGIAEAWYHKVRFQQAAGAAEEALRFARTHDQKEVESHLLLLLSDIEIALGRLDDAESYRSRYDSVRSLLVNESMLKNVQELETKYAVEKGRRELMEKNLLLEEGRRIADRQRLLLFAAILALILLVGLLFIGFRFYRQKRELDRKAFLSLQAEQENIRLKSVLEGESGERRRISQEMHDDMGAGLTSLLFLSRTLPGGAGTQIGEGAQHLIQKMNEIIWSMNDEQDTLDSLLAYIRTNAASALDAAGIQYAIEAPEQIPEMPLGQAFRRNIYLVVKEAIHNIIRHSGAARARMEIGIVPLLRIVVSDDGKGLDSNKPSRFGNGMKNMQRRMETVGGTMSVKAENGMTLIFEAPWPV